MILPMLIKVTGIFKMPVTWLLWMKIVRFCLMLACSVYGVFCANSSSGMFLLLR